MVRVEGACACDLETRLEGEMTTDDTLRNATILGAILGFILGFMLGVGVG